MVETFSGVGADGCVVMRALFSSSRISFRSRRKYMLVTWAMIHLISAKLRGFLLGDMFLPIVRSKEECDVIKLVPKSKGSKADVPLRGNMSWGWRKILQIRPLVREFIWHNIGDGALTSLWYDRWCYSSPLANSISTRDMYRAGLNPFSKAQDIFLNNSWSWPQELIDKYPFLGSISMPNHTNRADLLEWCDENGNV
ncbi:hypothetical protein Tco_0941557 [Tanacetum coccineum]|uniref:Reverse transcriptase zinc-binding domain-containing protein n=1 Tax=Tanacetum coccineum TaxID=301880 RepID=A0ABQ5DRY5_9ASTR